MGNLHSSLGDQIAHIFRAYDKGLFHQQCDIAIYYI